MDDRHSILEPHGKAPAVGNPQIDFKVGVARDAMAVAIQVGDILMHCSPSQARETAHALFNMAKTVEALIARRDGKILSV
jgi:hypothetical protein